MIIFDCDGVLIDSEPLACRVVAEELTGAGFPFDADEVADRFTGMSDVAMYRTIEEEAGRRLPSDLGRRIHDSLMQAFRRELKAIEGIHLVLDGLDAAGRPYCVASSSTPERLRVTLGHVGLIDRFAAIFSASMVERGKPAPDLFLHAAQTMAVPAAACIVVEDSVAGVTAARAAGMRALGFCGASHCGPGHGDMLRQAGAVAVFDDMACLPDLL
jgi:HAD superfamily hydrolase (TIGR01509 family)